jgi:hypothetical protein
MNQFATCCAWRGRPALTGECIESTNGLTCHARTCLAEHQRECETCLSASAADVFPATRLFWECRCEEGNIHPYYQPDCPACNTPREEGAPASISNVLLFANEWRLDQKLVALLRDRRLDRWIDEPDEGPLIVQYENAVRLGDDDWLDAAYEERISGWGDDF